MSQTQTVVFYIIIACVSTFFIWLYVQFDAKYSKNFCGIWIRILLFVCAIALPVGVATVRYGIGTDYYYYVKVFRDHIQLEYGYYLLNIIAANIYNNPATIFFFSSLITMTFVTLGLLAYKSQISVPLGFFVFMFLYYLLSYNAVRQMVAVSIVFYAIQFIYKKQYLLYALLVLLAVLFHVTAVIGFAFIFISIQGKITGKIKRITLIACMIVAVSLFPTIFNFLVTTRLFSHFNLYVMNFDNSKIGVLKYAIPNLFLIIVFYKRLSSYDKKYQLFVLIGIMTVPLDILGYYNVWFSRLGYYTSITEIVFLPAMCKSLNKGAFRQMMYCYTVIYTCALFFDQYLIHGFQQVIPYTTVLKG